VTCNMGKQGKEGILRAKQHQFPVINALVMHAFCCLSPSACDVTVCKIAEWKVGNKNTAGEPICTTALPYVCGKNKENRGEKHIEVS
jgi:hypothetical protein